MLQSKIACQHFLCLYQPRPHSNWLMETRDMPKEFVLYYVALLTLRLYNHLDQFIIFQVTLPALQHQVPSSFILVLNRLHLNLLNIVTFLTLNVVIGYHPTRLTTILNIFNSKLSISIIAETRILFSQLSVDFQNKLSLYLFIIFLVISLSLD